ncbi:DUF1850 domain-containing protein [Alkalispirochaeta sphaeroplastigenens]|uniref:DUF1850 domain-containing protein n=1 Tax=Alkalispirochaeta sphaeroplastigenens TaxID=1187066 RepID=UPI0034DADB01
MTYRHSVARSLVSEIFIITPCGLLRLQRTVYRDFGAGLPAREAGGFTHRDGMFVLDVIDLELSELPLRVGRTADHRILTGEGGEFRLIEMVPPGSLVLVKPTRSFFWHFLFFGGYSSVWKNVQQVFMTVLTKR